MDDGSCFSGNRTGLRIATNCFLLEELVLLQDLLYRKYNIKTSLHRDKNYYVLYIKAESAYHFAELVEPHMVNSMKYKLGVYSQYKNKVK